MRAWQFNKFGPLSNSNLGLYELPSPKADQTTAIVEIRAASITPSDVMNIEGTMKGTTLPRVPGRDYAGTVAEGPADWIGEQVWGTGGEIGYSINGSHAERIAVPVASLRRMPGPRRCGEAVMPLAPRAARSLRASPAPCLREFSRAREASRGRFPVLLRDR